MANFNWPINPTTFSAGPIQFTKDGVSVEVSEDTGTPANNVPLPVKDLTSQTKLDTIHTDLAAEAVLIGAVTETAPASDTASSGLNGRLQRIAQRLTSLIALLPASIGQKLMAGSLSVTVASDQSAVPISAAALPLPSGAATEVTQAANGVLVGAVNETAPASDTASSGLNGRLQRIAQRLTSLIALLPSSIGQKAMAGSFSVAIASDQGAVPVSAASLPLPSGAATETTLTANGVLIGAVAETAPASDTASSGLNGRLQRIAQRLTSLIALFPATLGQKVSASSFAVTIASDQSAVASKSPVNTNGSVVNTTLTGTTAAANSAPANAVGFILEAPSTNTDNIRWAIGSTASTTVGLLLEPGRDTGFVPCAASISVCATVSGTNKFEIQWILSS
jgi:hypothetical protein